MNKVPGPADVDYSTSSLLLQSSYALDSYMLQGNPAYQRSSLRSSVLGSMPSVVEAQDGGNGAQASLVQLQSLAPAAKTEMQKIKERFFINV